MKEREEEGLRKGGVSGDIWAIRGNRRRQRHTHSLRSPASIRCRSDSDSPLGDEKQKCKKQSEAVFGLSAHEISTLYGAPLIGGPQVW